MVPLALPTFATSEFLEFFKLERALRVTGNGRVVHLFVIYGFQGAEGVLRSCSSLIGSCKLFLLKLGWYVLVSLVLIAGDLNADPAVIPCLARVISAGRFVDFALAHSLAGETACYFLQVSDWMIVLVLVGTSFWVY